MPRTVYQCFNPKCGYGWHLSSKTPEQAGATRVAAIAEGRYHGPEVVQRYYQAAASAGPTDTERTA